MDAQKEFVRLSRKYKTPKQVQNFLRKFPYNREEKKETQRSAYAAFKYGKAHCLEAAFIAAAILEHHGYPPLVVSFESQDSLGHVIYAFKQNGKWGSIGKSRDNGLHGREPIFRSIRDLVWSYYAEYIDNTGKITEYKLANLDDTKTDWRYSKKNVWKAEKYLAGMKHIPLKSSEKTYQRLFRRFKKYGHPKPEKYWW